MKNARTISTYGIFIAVALVCSYIESQLPAFFPIPGIKLGLTNVVVLLALYKRNAKCALVVNAFRIILVSFMFGGFVSLAYSFAGGILSSITMILLKKIKRLKIITISIAGGIMHNVGQIIVAIIILQTSMLAWYFVILWFSGIATGLLIGILGAELVKRMPDSIFTFES